MKEINLAGIYFDHPLMNAAGTCKKLEEVKELVKTNSAAIMVGSITLIPRESESGETLYLGNDFSLNSVGLANPGLEYYNQHLPEMVEIVHKAGKPIFVSVAGFNPSEYAILAKFCLEKEADFVELNLSCPNVWKNEKQERILCFHPIAVKKILESVEKTVGKEAKISVKISYFSDYFLLKKISEIISHFESVKAVTSTNAIPNCIDFDEKGRQRLSRLAAMAGPRIKPMALGQVIQLRKFLPKRIDIIGVGGISSGKDIIDFQLRGTKIVQICTHLLRFNSRKWRTVFDSLLIEYFKEL